MTRLFGAALAVLIGVAVIRPMGAVVLDRSAQAPVAPRLLSETGLYAPGSGLAIDQANRPFAPQYPLWSDGAVKRRWIRIPEGATIDVSDPDRWDFPIGTRLWKEFEFHGRKVETRLLWKTGERAWVFATYAWNDAQSDAALAPEAGLPHAAAIAPGRSHGIPSVTDCRACHDSARTEVLGFNALQLSTDRDPLAPHAEAATPEMVTLRTLVSEDLLRPRRPEWLASPPRVDAPSPEARAALGYLSANCGNCHNEESDIASLGLFLKHRVGDAGCQPALATTVNRRGHWVVPAHPDESRIVRPGRPEASALVQRVRSRRPSSQMPPIGSVVPDAEAVALLTKWIGSNLDHWEGIAIRCAGS